MRDGVLQLAGCAHHASDVAIWTIAYESPSIMDFQSSVQSLTVSGFEIGKGVLCRAPMVSLICDHESPIRKALLLIFLRSLAFGLLLLYDWYMEAKVPSLSISTCKFCLRASGR